MAFLLLLILILAWGGLMHHRRRRRHHRRPRISLLVPFHTDHGQRERNWAWLERYWRYHLPEAELIIADDRGVPFCKTAAVNRAFHRCLGDIVVILDADCLLPASTIRWCAEEIREARSAGRHLWFLPYRRFYRLTEQASRRVLHSDFRHPAHLGDPPPPGDYEQRHSCSSGHFWGALCQVMPREAFLAAGGMDENFRGWGGEDVSFMHAVDTLYGRHRTFNGPVYHLWHPTVRGAWKGSRQWAGQPAPDMNDPLSWRYAQALGDRRRMRRLVAEHARYQPPFRPWGRAR